MNSETDSHPAGIPQESHNAQDLPPKMSASNLHTVLFTFKQLLGIKFSARSTLMRICVTCHSYREAHFTSAPHLVLAHESPIQN